MNKIKIFLSIIFITIITYLIILYIPKNYKVDYIVNKVKIKENFDKENKIYNYILTYNNIDYPFFILDKYSTKQKHIKNIEITNNNDSTCLKVKEFNKIMCSSNEELIDYRLLDKPKEEIKKSEFNNISIYNNDNKYYIWNYNGFLSIGHNNNKLKIFNNEKYTSTNTYQANEYLIIPDYDSSYYFNKIYILNTNTNKINEINFKYEISYNLLYLGIYKNKVYFLDLKNENEYELNLKKKTIKLLNEKNNNGLYYDGNKMITKKVKTMVKNKETFKTKENKYKYIIKDNNIYQKIDNYLIKISNKKITDIITQINNTIYYLSEDKLYSYNYDEGEKLLLTYTEWKFNYKNQIFIFNK